jgi:hypothetical protein
MFVALAVPNFRRYVVGRALNLIGTSVETVAQSLLVLRLTPFRGAARKECSKPVWPA